VRSLAFDPSNTNRVYVGILELMTKPAPKPAAEKAAGDQPKLELTGHSAAVGADPVIDQYRRRLSMTVLS